MVSNAGIALELGYLKIPQGTWVKMENLRDLHDEEVVIITTGSQGEPMSALSRVAVDNHKHISVDPGDTVALAAGWTETVTLSAFSGLGFVAVRVMRAP